MVGGLALLRHRQNPRNGATVAADHQLTLGRHQLVEATDIGPHVSDTELFHGAEQIVLQFTLVQHAEGLGCVLGQEAEHACKR